MKREESVLNTRVYTGTYTRVTKSSIKTIDFRQEDNINNTSFFSMEINYP